jgi:hypothetical protein
MHSNLSAAQANPRSIFFGTANGPSHRLDNPGLELEHEDDEWPDATSMRMYHYSDHKFNPGDPVLPASVLTGNDGGSGRGSEAWASIDPTYGKNNAKHVYEVEPLEVHHWGSERASDPETGRFWSKDTPEWSTPTGYRVVQEVTPKEK